MAASLMKTVALLSVYLGIACASAAGSKHGRTHQLRRDAASGAHDGARGFVQAMDFKQRLRVCNAYPSESSMQVYRGEAEQLTSAGPMAYKTCRDFATLMKPGDKLVFKVGDLTAGTFAISDLPNSDAVLLLVIHRHDTSSTAVSFESHVFANLANAQVAVIDTYKGNAKATPRITDELGGKASRSEALRYSSVVAVNPGKYDVVLDDDAGAEKAKRELVALNRESYVVLRTGVEAQTGESFAEDLVVFPQSDPVLLHSGATSARFCPLAALILLVAAARELAL